MKIIKKIGSILFCLLPVLLAFGIQLIVSFAGIFLRLFAGILADPALLNDFKDANVMLEFLSSSQFLAGISAVYAVIAALVLGFWYWKRFVPKKQPRRKPSSLVNPQIFLGLLLLMVGMQYISTYVVMLLAAINPGWYNTYQELMESIGFGDITLILALYSVLIAPISEELIFRGVTMNYAVKTLPFFLANILQAFLFGAFHANIIQGTYAFVVGLFCGYVCYQGGSIYLSILFHMMFNIWGTFASDFLSYSGNSIILHLVIFVGACCFAVIGVLLYQKGLKKRSPMPEAYTNTRNRQDGKIHSMKDI